MPFSVMKEAFEELGIEVSGDLFSYMGLLFYTDEFVLDSVPYLNFLEAYKSESPNP